MSNDEVTLGMSVPLDTDGFLRRECPTCEREFKWMASTNDEDDGEPAPDGGYFCPYCGIQAPSGSWFTHAQIDLATNTVAREIVSPSLKDFARDLGPSSGGFLSVGATYDEPEAIDPLTEADDMKRVDFACHPAEPVKVLDDWDQPVRCLMCGEFSR